MVAKSRRPVMVRITVVIALVVATWWLPQLRRRLLFDVTYWDAPAGTAPELPSASGSVPVGLAKTPRTRVVLIDGLAAFATPAMPTWTATCKRGLSLSVDVGFPTVSLPVEIALWTGLTQQQTGIVHRGGGRGGVYGHPLDPPLGATGDRRGIPAQVAGSVAVAENHGWIVRSLGFSRTLPEVGENPAEDLDPARWKTEWVTAARDAVAGSSPLVFVHVLRVDTAGHRHGTGALYGLAAGQSDAILARLIAADPDARWFLLSDHGHEPTGGHGGTERAVRQVAACIAGPGVVPGTGPLVHVVDIARAIADSTGATLSRESRGRPLGAALAAPLADDQAVPRLDLTRGVLALFVLGLGLGATVWGGRRWWLAPWWFVASVGALLVVRGEPSLSAGWIYPADGRAMAITWLPALALAVAATWIGLGRTTLARVLGGQLALPVAVLAACLTVTGAWPAVFGAEQAPVAPRYTAWTGPVALMVAHGAAAVALGVLARLVQQAVGRRAREAPPRSAPEDDA